MKYERLGAIQIAILQLLIVEQMERSEIYKQLRKSLYKSSKSKASSRQAFQYSINALKKRKLIEEHFGTLVLSAV